MSRGVRRRRWPWAALGTLGVASFGVGAVGTLGAGAQEGGRVVIGYDAVAASDGIGGTFGDPDAQPYPVAAGQIAHTEATMSTGPSGYALASTAWPGPLAANAGSLAVLLGAPPQAGHANYAGRAEALSPSGPHESELPGMRAHAEGGLAEATAGAQDVENEPGAFTGDVQTVSRSTFENGALQATSTCTASDMTFGGENGVKIGSVRTEAQAATDGTASTAGGRTVVSGMTVGGQAAEVDEEGVRFVDPVTAPIGEQILANMGIEMFVAQPRTSEEGNRASHHAGSLVVLWDFFGSGHQWVYSICGSDASVSLRSGTAFVGAPPLTAPPRVTPTSAAPRPAASPSAAPRTPPSPTTAPADTGDDEIALALEPAGFVRDLSIWPYIIGAACCVAAGYGLRRGRDVVLDPRAAATACPLEGARP